MPKSVLVTAGPVYGPLDGNKLVSNRVRGIWAVRFAVHLAELGYGVHLLVADTLKLDPVRREVNQLTIPGHIEVVRHSGFGDYRMLCEMLASEVDAAVMAAAVVNWIPARPVPGKMVTEGYKEGDEIQVPFVLAPRVINRMKEINPRLTLIGCKMLIGADVPDLIDAAYGVLLRARCNMVIANDMGFGLRCKFAVHKDRSVIAYENDFARMYADMVAVVEDEYYQTVRGHDSAPGFLGSAYGLDEDGVRDRLEIARATFDWIVNQNRERFTPVEGGRVFGAVAVAVDEGRLGWLVSPREKGELFSSREAAWVVRVGGPDEEGARTVAVVGETKASLNAPLLIRALEQTGQGCCLHLHEGTERFGTLQPPCVPYAPPGTVRDSEREIPGPRFYIAGHGTVDCFDVKWSERTGFFKT